MSLTTTQQSQCFNPLPPPKRGETRRVSDHDSAKPVFQSCAFYLFIRQPHGSEVSPAARNTLDSARIPRASKLLICGLFQKGRVLAQDGMPRSRAETLGPGPGCTWTRTC